MTRRFFWRALAAVGLTSIAAEARAQQPRLNDRTLGGGTEGINRTGNIFQFTTAAGNPAPTRLGIYLDGDPEPLSPAESGAAWIKVSGPADDMRAQLKINVAGNALICATANYRLSPSAGD